MYTLIVVDDEEDIRQGIVRSIAWEDWGFRVIGEAGNGLQAISLIEELSPDVVLSDIRMPGMDGVELLRYVQEHHPQTLVVILSGYSDFAYMESAVRHNAALYLLKPTDIDAFEEAFRAIHERLNRQRKEEETQEKSAAYLRNFQLTRLVREGQAAGEELEAVLSSAGLPTDARGCRLLLIAPQYTVEWFETIKGWPTTQRIMLSLLGGEMQANGGACRGVFFLYDGRMACGLVYEADSDIDAFWRSAYETLRASLDIPPLVTGLSDAAKNAEDLPALLLQARRQLSPRPAGTMLSGEAPEAALPPVHEITLLMTERKTQALSQLLEAVTAQIILAYGEDLLEIDRAFMKLLFRLSDAAEKVSIDLSSAIQAKGYAFETLYALESAVGKRCFVLFAVRLLLGRLASAQTLNTNEMLAAEALAIVDAVFDSDQMSLGYVAQRMSRSEAYISRIFKEVTGESFTQYVRKKRMERAYELLRDTTLQAYMIAQQVGYPDLSNFQKTFKKFYGMTPAECRRKSREGRIS